ncbi:unnamed protein product [Paramecium pentaurelia]|uniref:RNA helicase n=1 Tax=Paramecium pentaurelia TaxID=43138 RepID=A0A8S1WBR6_9CILI|nr:unnamed protein product [Paramecium pentaurelia]
MIAAEELAEDQQEHNNQLIQNGKSTFKPQFLSKQQREELKQKQEEQQHKSQLQKQQQIAQIRKEYIHFRSDDQKVRQILEKKRSKSRSRSKSKEKNNRYITSNTRATVPVKMDGENQELMHIKMQYLGLNKEKKKILKPSEKFKNIFNFEWDATEDTSIDFNPLYMNRINASGLHSKVQEDKDPDQLLSSDHWSKKSLSQMQPRDWRIFREDMDIIIKGGRVPNPIREWNEVQLPKNLMNSIRNLNYVKPTPIQMQTIPIGLERKDMIGIAPTGSGKSAAFLIPLITYLSTLPKQDDKICKDGPYALIMAPARELAIQIEAEFQKLSQGYNLRSFVIVGGRKEEEQEFHLKKGIEILIGTPGRIKDLLMKKYLVLEQCSWIVLDEADKMIDLGFEQDVNYILDSITTQMKSEDEIAAELEEKLAQAGERQYRVTHLFSATMPPQVEKLAKRYLRAFCFISIGEPGGGKKDIEQKIDMINEAAKKNRLLQLLAANKPPIIIFANQKKSVEILSKTLEKYGYNSVVYHGSKTQQQREAAVEGFKSKKIDILIATDLASRGLHVEGVQMVINFDAPKNIQDFIHRTGRTGRAGKRGLAVTFLTNSDQDLFYDLKEYLIKSGQNVPPELAQHTASNQKPGSVPDNVPRRKQVILAH